MLLTISTTYQPATDLGYLLYKHPDQVQTFALNYGCAHVFYPEARADRCQVALLLDIDPVALVRGRKGSRPDSHALEQYVNDRPYVASSFLSVAIAEVFGTALAGKCKVNPELVSKILPLEAEISCLPCHGGEALLKRFFAPLGYEIEVTTEKLDVNFPEWGQSRYHKIKLSNNCRLSELLSHLYVLIPVLDDDKHYFVGDDEVEKLLRHGKAWLAAHPERELISSRYLSHKRSLTRSALARLTEDENADIDETEEKNELAEASLEERLSLNEERTGTVISVLKKYQTARVIDLGCGEGKLIKALIEHKEFDHILGLEVSHRSLEMADRRLNLSRLPEKAKKRVELIQGSLTYRDRRMEGFDAATCIEVIEHMDLPRLAAFERVVFQFARPKVVIITTPNSEYNVKFVNLPAGKFRHRDHRFEWTRSEFQTWARNAAGKFGYTVTFLPVGDEDATVGSPTQMGVFAL